MMRPAPALVSALLLAASTAVAAPTPDQGAASPQTPPASAPRVRPAPASAPTGLTRAGLRTYRTGSAKTDPGTEANCYIVFGEVRCARMDRPPQSTDHR